jgi:hypothetical protein
VTRLPTRPVGASGPGNLEQLEELEELEELGDDAIIAQQQGAHAPQPRANVSEESRSIVISEPPVARPAQAPVRPRGEPTLIIRDRRALDDMRRQIIERQRRKKNSRRSLYVWGVIGVVAFVLGGIVAFLATDTRLLGH